MTPVSFLISAGLADKLQKFPKNKRARFAVHFLSHAFDEAEEWGENPRALTAEDWEKMPRGERIALERALAEPPGNSIPMEEFFAKMQAKIEKAKKNFVYRPPVPMTFDLPDEIAALFHAETDDRNEIANEVMEDAFMGIWQTERDAEIEADEDARLARLVQSGAND